MIAEQRETLCRRNLTKSPASIAFPTYCGRALFGWSWNPFLFSIPLQLLLLNSLPPGGLGLNCSSGLLKLLPWTKKKEPSSRFAARRTLFHLWYHARLGAISAGPKSRTVTRSDLPCADPGWSSMISQVEQRSSRLESRWWFFFLSRVVYNFEFDQKSSWLFLCVLSSQCRCWAYGHSPRCRLHAPTCEGGKERRCLQLCAEAEVTEELHGTNRGMPDVHFFNLRYLWTKYGPAMLCVPVSVYL